MDHQDKVNEEVKRLVEDFIPRLGQTQEDGRFGVRYGDLFDDDEGQQYFEAIMGTLKAAKRQNLIDFKGQMLLKGLGSLLQVFGHSYYIHCPDNHSTSTSTVQASTTLYLSQPSRILSYILLNGSSSKYVDNVRNRR